jgi:hypothetical protein
MEGSVNLLAHFIGVNYRRILMIIKYLFFFLPSQKEIAIGTAAGLMVLSVISLRAYKLGQGSTLVPSGVDGITHKKP